MAFSHGNFLVIAQEDGKLPLPAQLRRALSLAPGDLLSIQPFIFSIHLQIYQEFLNDSWTALADEARWHYLTEFLSRPLTVIDFKGRILIPPEMLQIQKRDEFNLQVFNYGHVHALFLTQRRRPPRVPQRRLSLGPIAGQVIAPEH